MSGHSKWHTIKHKKGALDAKRGKLFTRLIKEMTVAARNGGGDINMNPRLRTVVTEAKAANIPVILTDRAVDSKDDSLYVTFLGSDFVEEGKKAGEWVVNEYKDASAPVNIVQLEGTTGAAPAIDRAEGFADTISSNPNLTVIASQTGDFTRDGGKQVMESFLNSEKGIDVVFAHNDDMGLGAIEAIEAAGLEPGKDIKIITVDAVRDGIPVMLESEARALDDAPAAP